MEKIERFTNRTEYPISIKLHHGYCEVKETDLAELEQQRDEAVEALIEIGRDYEAEIEQYPITHRHLHTRFKDLLWLSEVLVKVTGQTAEIKAGKE